MVDRVKRTGKLEEFYDLDRELGKGAFAVVNLCHKKGNPDERYAVKIIQKGGSPTQKETVETEVRIMAALNHANIVKLIDLFETPETYSLVMELITGGELFDKIIEIQSYSEWHASRLIRQILMAIKHCHDRNIVHRDLKPENLLLAPNMSLCDLKPENLLLATKDVTSDVKLADFGLSKDLNVTPELFNCAGTPGYIAPEILEAYFNKVPYGKTVDLWSTGVILYILVYGFPPFWEEDQDEMFAGVMNGQVPQFSLTFHDSVVEFDTWVRIHQVSALRHHLGEGFKVHFVQNDVCQQIFDVIVDKNWNGAAMTALEKRTTKSSNTPTARARSIEKTRTSNLRTSNVFVTDGDDE